MGSGNPVPVAPVDPSTPRESPSPTPQYIGSIESAVGDGTHLWLVTRTESCGGGPPGAGTIQRLSGVGGMRAEPFVDAQGTPDYVATDSFEIALIDPATNAVVFSADLAQWVTMIVINDEPWLIGADGQAVYRADDTGIHPVSLTFSRNSASLPSAPPEHGSPTLTAW